MIYHSHEEFNLLLKTEHFRTKIQAMIYFLTCCLTSVGCHKYYLFIQTIKKKSHNCEPNCSIYSVWTSWMSASRYVFINTTYFCWQFIKSLLIELNCLSNIQCPDYMDERKYAVRIWAKIRFHLHVTLWR